jgi:hypothetical protein
MTKIAFPLTLLATMLVCALSAAPAQTQPQLNYTVVSTPVVPGLPSLPGPSPSCGSIQSPCRTLQEAFSVTAENGVIDVLNPGEYGPVNITHAVSIQGHGWASVTAASGTAITINAGASDEVNIRGVLLDGLGTGANGIAFNYGASLNIQDSVLRNFSTGVYSIFLGSNQILMSNTLISHNSSVGILIQNNGEGTVSGVFEHVEIENNKIGLSMQPTGTIGAINITVNDSVISNNTQYGIYAIGGTPLAYAAVRRSNISNNGTGVYGASTAIIRLSQCQITGNATGWSTSYGSVTSTSDNMIDDNPNGNGGPPAIAYK